MYLVCTIYFVWLMLYEYITNKKSAVLLAVSCAIIATLISIRYQIGSDYNNYLPMFRALLQDPNSYPSIEIGWRYITYSLSFVGFNEYGCFAFWGVVTVSLMYYGIKRHAPFPLISCGYFFFGYTIGGTFNILRQMVVCAIVIAGLDIIKNRRHWTALCLFLIALSIHRVAILLPPLYILVIYDRIIGKHKYWILFAALFLGIGGYAISLLLASTHYMPHGIITSKTVEYLTEIKFNESEWGIISIAKRFLLVLGILCLSEKIYSKWDYARVTVSLYFWGNTLALLLLSSFVMSRRICLLVKILDLLILPSLLLVSEKPMWKKIVITVIIAWCLFAFYRSLSLTPNAYPFRTIFDPT